MARYTKALRREKSEIVFRHMREGLSMRKACLKVGIPVQTLCTWRKMDEYIDRQYARAREDLIDYIADEILTIADSDAGTDDRGRVDNGEIQKHRLQVEARKWLLSKIAPKQYGDRLELAGDQENPIGITKIERVVIDSPKNTNATVDAAATKTGAK